jgi:hypothetical protein
MTIPTLEWFPTSITGTLGSYQAWNGSPIDAEVMITAFLDTVKKFLKANGAIDNVTVFTQATSTSPNIPRASKALAVTGTSADSTAEAAVSRTFNFKTAINGNMKIVILDSPLPSTWLNKVLPASFTSNEQDLVDEILANSNAWSGRDDSDISTCRSITWDVNDKLQRKYFK